MIITLDQGSLTPGQAYCGYFCLILSRIVLDFSLIWGALGLIWVAAGMISASLSCSGVFWAAVDAYKAHPMLP